jgi:hypothetical protein
MILLFAKRGNHNKNFRLNSDEDVRHVFEANGIDFNNLVEKCRNYPHPIPLFENLISSTAYSVGGSSLARVDRDTLSVDLQVDGPGTLSLYGYWSEFESAAAALERAIENLSYNDLLVATVHGIASIEGYVNYRAELWNKHNPANQLVDSKAAKISFDDKINIWIPIMTGGRKLDKGEAWWSDFKKLQSVRDDVAVHPKVSARGISYADLSKLINRFGTGIATFLLRLHMLFNDRIPATIIRAAYSPSVEVAESSNIHQ